MPALELCPDARTLERHLLGLTPEPEASRLDEHICACEQCWGVAGVLSGVDEFTESVRSAAERVGQLPQEEAVRQLIARNRHLGPLAQETGAPSFGSDASSWVDPEETQELFEFLRPPEAAGELGRLGPYRVLQVIGRGGMGIVFEAEDPHLGRSVALKVMKPSLAGGAKARARFLREARAVAALPHDHVVPIFQAGEDRGIPYLAMPLLEGESLDARLKREGALPVKESLRIAREAALGLDAAHAKGLIHRDVKPANIWLEAGSGRVRLLDFGLVRAPDGDPSLTLPEALAGTPQYMSPEQARGKPLTPRSDLFSLGCVLYHMLTGRLPFPGDDALSTLAALAGTEPVPPAKLVAGLPRAVSQLVLRLLARSPDARPESARAAAEAIAAAEQALEAPPPTRWRGVLASCAFVTLLLSAIVLHVRTDGGTIVLTVNEPDAAVVVDGTPQRCTITSPRETVTIRVAPGQHTLQVSKDGFTSYTNDFRLDRGGRTVLTARLEPLARRPAVPPDSPAPFTVIRADGSRGKSFPSLVAALTASTSGEAIEVAGNGPFRVPPIEINAGDNKSFIVRAAPGYRPRFVPAVIGADESPWVWWLDALHPFWIRVLGAPLKIEGCDFVGMRTRMLDGGDARWEIVNCRILNEHGPTVEFHNGTLRIADCLLATEGRSGVAAFGALSQVTLENNVIRDAWEGNLIHVSSNQGATHLRLRHNTFVDWGYVFAAIRSAGSPAITIEASDNLFVNGWLAGTGELTANLRADIDWHGRDNLYTGWMCRNPLFAGRDFETDPTARPAPGLTGWKAYWGDAERGGRESPEPHFEWAEVYLARPDAALELVRRRTARVRAETHLTQLGPDWNLVGPGPAYLRALAAAGRPVAPEQLRPAAGEFGSFVIVHEGHPDRGHFSMALAVAAAADGDVIEVRSDADFPNAEFPPVADRVRPLTIRAGAGYRPALSGHIKVGEGNVVSLEGFDFRDARLETFRGPPGRPPGRIARLANCSATSRLRPTNEPDPPFLNIMGPVPPGPPLEIVNCLFYGRQAGGAGGIAFACLNGQLALRNSVVSKVFVDGIEDGNPAIALDRCVVWNPDLAVNDGSIRLQGKLAAQVALSARDTLFELGGRVVMLYPADKTRGETAARWDGARNVYRNGSLPLVAIDRPDGWHGTADLAAWRQFWKTADEGSVALDSPVEEPSAWRLLPDSPGYRAAADGTDTGADVSRVARTQPADRKAPPD